MNIAQIFRSPSRIMACRICGNSNISLIIDLGLQVLTGRFQALDASELPRWPVTLVKCEGHADANVCGCLQLLHSYDQTAFFGSSYGYKSSVTQTMRDHLSNKAKDLAARASLKESDVVLDIGCNDCTFLSAMSTFSVRLFGCDPSSGSFVESVDKSIDLTVDFFPSQRLEQRLGDSKPRVVTSIACFYDVDDPVEFARQVKAILAWDGLWEIEIAYMPRIVEMLGYDTILHEHAVYYGLSQIEWIAAQAGLRVYHAEENAINGASLRILLTHAESDTFIDTAQLLAVREWERVNAWQSREKLDEFALRVLAQRDEFAEFLARSRIAGKRLFAYGASTKGNVVLQYCGATNVDIAYALERYPPKYGLVTPGTNIMIIPEERGRQLCPDALIVLIWQFKDEVLKRERAFLEQGGKIILLFPSLEIHGANGPEPLEDFWADANESPHPFLDGLEKA